MTIFGVPFDELDAGRLQAHLEQAGDEPLLWEAKGTEVHRNEVLRQVCGFANSHEGGYLILGATPSAATEGDEGEKRWELNGVKFSDEPRTWISNVVTDPERGVRPRPDFDVVAWPAPGGHVAVVRVSPTSTPPCIANGTIYERVPGKTQTVRDPQILAGLFSRGDQARRDAQGRADRAAIALIQNWLPEGSAEFRQQTWVPDAEEDEESTEDTDFLRFSVGVAATGNASDIPRRLFREEFAIEIWTRLNDRPSGLPAGLQDHSPDSVYLSQDALTWRHLRTLGPLNSLTVVRAIWDGSASAGQKIATEDVYPDQFADARVAPQWGLADELVRRLGGSGDVFVTVVVAGGRFPQRTDEGPIVMRRGPITPGVTEGHVASLGRELMRAVGYLGFEPSD